MILQALARYYDILASDPDSGVAPPGYSLVGISFALQLSPEGDLLGIIPLFEKAQRGKSIKEVPRQILVPQQVKRSGTSPLPNFLWDNGAFVLGLSAKNDTDPEYAQKRFTAFREYNRGLLSRAGCPAARAVIAFLDRYEPAAGAENPVIAPQLEAILKGGNLVFQVEGIPGFVHNQPEIRRVWEAYKTAYADAYTSQCLVTGEVGPVARLHPSLKGVRGGQPTGATLVGFNARAYESYNRVGGQGLNAPVSEQAAFAYTTALNTLLASGRQKIFLADTTVVYWAESPEKAYTNLVASLFDPESLPPEPGPAPAPGRDPLAEQRLAEVAQKVRQAAPVDVDGLLKDLDPAARFYVLGLAPNSARLSVRFFHADLFRSVVEKLVQHYADLQIVKEHPGQPGLISLWRIVAETVSRKAAHPEPAPLLAGALFRAVLENTPYPAALYLALLNRIRADADDPKQHFHKINYTRAAAIKAYLIRKYRRQNQPQIQEVLCMSLNEQSTHPAYLLGRLFAVLEKAQAEAIGEVNASIKDRYFTSACASPASVFPILLRLSQHHINKAEYGHVIDRNIETILGLLKMDEHPIPAHLSLDEQGIFILGYYHQRAAFYTKKTAPADEPAPTAS